MLLFYWYGFSFLKTRRTKKKKAHRKVFYYFWSLFCIYFQFFLGVSLTELVIYGVYFVFWIYRIMCVNMSDETSDGGISPNNQRHVDWQKKIRGPPDRYEVCRSINNKSHLYMVEFCLLLLFRFFVFFSYTQIIYYCTAFIA